MGISWWSGGKDSMLPHCRGRGFHPGQGTNIPHASQCIPQIKNKSIKKIKDEGVKRLWDMEGDSHGAQAVLTREVTSCGGPHQHMVSPQERKSTGQMPSTLPF